MNRTEAEEHLRVIRSLMEKATIYRAISAPTALVGGILSVLMGIWLHMRSVQPMESNEEPRVWFVGGWMAVLLITSFANFVFIHRDARKRAEPFLSSGMLKALWALFPSFLTAAVLTSVFGILAYQLLPATWMLFYGLGLLATSQFSPRAISLLGWAFLVSALATIIIMLVQGSNGSAGWLWQPNLVMIATFGVLHLVYALGAWWSRGDKKD